MEFKLNIDQMFKYREILQSKAEIARSSGNQNRLNALLSRIDAIDMVIDSALIATLTVAAPFVAKAIDSRMFDRPTLELVIGKTAMKGLPSQGTIDFVVVDEEATESTPSRETLENSLRELLKRNITTKIDEAVKLYNEFTGENLPNAKAWIKVKELMHDNRILGMWDKSILGSLISFGPIVAFTRIKKHLTHWDDVDIALLLNDAVERASRMKETEEEALRTREKAYEIFEDSVMNVREYVHDKHSINAICGIEKLDGKTAIGRRFKQIFDVTSPTVRTKILGRKEYIEKGY